MHSKSTLGYEIKQIINEFATQPKQSQPFFSFSPFWVRVGQEARHQHGMKCLGIPNTKAFYEITSIQDAVALHKSFVEKKNSEWQEYEEEYEGECWYH